MSHCVSCVCLLSLLIPRPKRWTHDRVEQRRRALERLQEKRIKMAFNLIIANSKWVFWTNEMHPDKRSGIEAHRVFPTQAHIQNIGYSYALQTVSLKCVARWMCHSPFIVHIVSIIAFLRTGYIPLAQRFFQLLEFFSSLLHSSFCVIYFLCVLVQGHARSFSHRILSNHSNKQTLHWANDCFRVIMCDDGFGWIFDVEIDFWYFFSDFSNLWLHLKDSSEFFRIKPISTRRMLESLKCSILFSPNDDVTMDRCITRNALCIEWIIK